jgi:hypothetical protein
MQLYDDNSLLRCAQRTHTKIDESARDHHPSLLGS